MVAEACCLQPDTLFAALFFVLFVRKLRKMPIQCCRLSISRASRRSPGRSGCRWREASLRSSGRTGRGRATLPTPCFSRLGSRAPGCCAPGRWGMLIFSGSETLPAASAAEVTLVLDNEEGRISLPYSEVSISRRISRSGETEYRINGSRARLADIRSVAGEIGLGRHSILRQGAVDSIVAGGAAACRLALEEAAGLGVFQEAARLGQPEAGEGRRPTGEEPPTRGGARRAIAQDRAGGQSRPRVQGDRSPLPRALPGAPLQDRNERTGRSEAEVGRSHRARRNARRQANEKCARKSRESNTACASSKTTSGRQIFGWRRWRTAQRTCGPRHCARTEPSCASRPARGREGERRLAISRLRGRAGPGRSHRARPGRTVHRARSRTRREGEESDRLQKAVARSRERSASAERERTKLSREVEGLRARIAGLADGGEANVMPEEELARLGAVIPDLEKMDDRAVAEVAADCRMHVDARSRAWMASPKRSAVAAARWPRPSGGPSRGCARCGRRAPAGSGTRLYEVIRARPGYEVAVEAALGEYGAGVLAENLDEGMKLLSQRRTRGRPPGRARHGGERERARKTTCSSASRSRTSATRKPCSGC